MKRVSKILLALLFVFYTSQVLAQYSGLYWNNLNESSNRLQGKITGETYFISPLENRSFFLQNDWVDSRIILEDGDVYDNLKVRYLVYSDELIAYNDKLRTLFKVDKNKINRFFIIDTSGEKEFVKLDFNGIQPGYRFFEVLFSGTSSLLAFHRIDEISVNPYLDKFGIMRDSEYKLNINYYLYSQEKGFEKLTAKKRSFRRLFPEHKKEIRKIFRRNKISLSGKESMVQAVELLNQAGLLR